jgi:hypothetical protein
MSCTQTAAQPPLAHPTHICFLVDKADNMNYLHRSELDVVRAMQTVKSTIQWPNRSVSRLERYKSRVLGFSLPKRYTTTWTLSRMLTSTSKPLQWKYALRAPYWNIWVLF